MTIKKTKIRGVESNGMLCSLEELGLPGNSEGIIELPASEIGAKVSDVLGINDPVIDIAITPNRADCLGVRGIARDLAAAGMGKLKDSVYKVQPAGFKSPVSVSIETTNCLQFIGCFIKGVKNIQSPEWMKKRLEAIGQKPISALVDITNYFTFDLGRPLHVYDEKKIGRSLSVRSAISGEKISALNGKEYNLQNGITVIADSSNVLAIGGIIGGTESGCSQQTTDIFLEIALFEPTSVAQAGRNLQIDSDARYRFERGVDVAFLEEAAHRAAAMIIELCGGQASELVIAGKTPQWKHEINFDPALVKSLGGVDIAPKKSLEILSSLGFAVNGNSVTPPSWRADIEGAADLVEEILRINGYENIPAIALPKLNNVVPNILSTTQKRINTSKRLLASRGMVEAKTWSFLPAKQAEIFGGNNQALTLINPISADLDTMRPSLLPNLLDAAKRNAARGFKDMNLFEVGLQFHDISPEGQKIMASGIRTGNAQDANYDGGLFTQKTRTMNMMDAKADAMALLQSLGINKLEASISNLPAYYHPNRSGAFVLGKTVLGYFGEIHPKIARYFDIDSRIAAFEIFLEAIPEPRSKSTAKPQLKISDYQAAERDFAFIVDEKIEAATIEKEIAKADKNLITKVEIFDVYSGKGVDAGKKSVAVKVTLQSFERTLSEADISAASNSIISSAGKGFGGVLRQ